MPASLFELLDEALLQSGTLARRLFHGRGKFYPSLEHLNIEWYPPYIWVQNFGDPLDAEQTEALESLFHKHPQVEAVLIQARVWPDFETRVLFSRQEPELPLQQWTPLSEKLVCQTTLGKNRNTGVFLDMRAGWHWIEAHSKGKRVLNLFSYTGVFSLFALQGGAVQVDNVDMAANVLKIAQRNHQKNELHDGKTAFYRRDILKSGRWFENREPYDLIIIDPPPYQKNAFRGWNDYQKLLKTCRISLAEGGVMIACLNNPQSSIEEFEAEIKALFPECKQLERIQRATEIVEKDEQKGLKTIAIQF